jgi:hypothetical protein
MIRNVLSRHFHHQGSVYALVIAALAISVRLYLLLSTGSTAEDFYITLRYAENLAEGQGLVYNPGERVLGTTTPLYALYLALVHWIGADPVAIGKGTNIFAEGLSCLLLYRLGRAAGRPGVGLGAAALLALSPPNLTWAVSGMETGLVTMTGLAVFTALAERRTVLMAVCAAILILLRIDGLILALIVFLSLILTDRRFPARELLVLTLIAGPWLLFATLYYGSPIPTSALAKLTVYAWPQRAAFPNALPFLQRMTATPVHTATLLCALLGATAVLRRYAILLPTVVWAIAHYAGMALSKVFLFGWYYIPPSPVYYLLAILGFTTAIDLAMRRQAVRSEEAQPAKAPPFVHVNAISRRAAAATLLIALLGMRGLPEVQRELYQAQQGEERLRKPIGIALREIVLPGQRVMLEPIGYIGYYSRARVLDAVGLVSPEALSFYRRDIVSPYLEMMYTLRPEYALLRTGEFQEAQQARVPQEKSLFANYRLIRTFSDSQAPPDAEPAFYLLQRK